MSDKPPVGRQRAVYAQLQPGVDALWAYIDSRPGYTPHKMAADIWGYTATGNLRRGSTIYLYLKGKRVISPDIIALVKAKLGLDLPLCPVPPRAKNKKKKLPPARRALVAYEEAKKLAPLSIIGDAPPPKAPAQAVPDRPEAWPVLSDRAISPRFSLVLGENGLACVMLNLVDVPIDSALRVFAALSGAGVLKPGEK